MRPALVVLLTLATATSAAADCRTSTSGAYSVNISVSALSGVLCISDVRVYQGQSCDGSAAWTTTLGCDETRRMVPTDEGRLVSLLSNRASRRNWEIVRVFTFDTDRVLVRSVRLDELPGLPTDVSHPRLRLDATNVEILTEPVVSVPVALMHTLGRAHARRRARFGR